MPLARPLQEDPVVLQPLALEPAADAGLDEQVDGALLEHPGPDPRLDVVAGASLDDDAVDACPGEQLRQQQTGGARADDGDLGTHGAEPDGKGCAGQAGG